MPGKNPSIVWRRKMTRFFYVFDIDGNGVLTKRDFDVLAKKFKEVGQMTDAEYLHFSQLLKEWWEGTIMQSEFISVNDFVDARWKQMKLAPNMHEARNDFKVSLEKMFRAIDLNGDGVISEHEWIIFFKAIGVFEEDVARAVFQRVDINKDQKMSLEEFINGGSDFMYNEKESVFMDFFGPLPPLNR